MHFETSLEFLKSRTYDEINVGDSSSLVRTLRPEDVKLFALMSGDMNPALAKADFRHSGLFRDFIAHGMWTASLMSTILGTQFPGPGTVLIDSNLHFARPVTIGDTITVNLSKGVDMVALPAVAGDYNAIIFTLQTAGFSIGRVNGNVALQFLSYSVNGVPAAPGQAFPRGTAVELFFKAS